MAQSVDIEIRVDQSGAVSGLRSFGNEMSSTTTKVQQLNVALGDANAKSARITSKGVASGVNPAISGLKQFSISGGSTAFGGLKKDAGEATSSVGQLNFSLGGVSSTLGTIAVEAPALEKVGGHALTSLDNVRLLRDDLGIRLPRSMEKAIASSKALSGLVNGLGTGLLAIGAIQIGFSVVSAAYDGLKRLWEEQLSLTKSAEDYEAEVQKTRDQAFGNSDSIEDTRLRIDAATEAVRKFQQQSAEADRPSTGWRNIFGAPGDIWQQLHQRSEARKLIDKSVEEQRKLDTLTGEADPKQYHEERSRSIDLEHARDESLRGQKRIDAEARRAIEHNAEDRRYSVEQQRVKSVESYDADGNLIPANPIDPNAGKSAESDANELAKRRAQAQTFNLQRQQGEELAHMREAALEAGLRGSALYRAQESAAIADLKYKDLDSAAARNAIHLRFHNEEMKRLQDQQLETQKILDDTKLAGLTGIAHVQQEGSNRVDEVNRDRDLDDNPQERAKRVAAIQAQTAQEVAEKQLEWTQRVDEVVEQSQTRQVSGFARIRAEADKASADLQRQFDEAHSKIDLTQPGAQAVYDQDTTKLGVGLNAISQSSDSQQAQLAEKNAQETLQIEQEAQRKSMSALRQQTAAINSEYDQRVSKYREQLRQQEISQEDFDRRVAAASKDRDAEMVEASRAAREKMAGQFDSLFKSLNHPMQALASLGEKVAGEAAAALVQKMQQRAGVSTANSPSKSGGLVGLIAGLMDGSAFSSRPASQATASAAAAPQPAATGPHSGFWPWSHSRAGNSAVPTSQAIPTLGPIVSAAAPGSSSVGHAFDLASATIRISAATILISGGAGALPSAGGIQAPIGGSTMLLGGSPMPRPSAIAGAPEQPVPASTGISNSLRQASQANPRFQVFGQTGSTDEQSWDDGQPTSSASASRAPLALAASPSTSGSAARVAGSSSQLQPVVASAPQPATGVGSPSASSNSSWPVSSDPSGSSWWRPTLKHRPTVTSTSSSESSFGAGNSGPAPLPGGTSGISSSLGGAGSSSVAPQGSFAGGVGDYPQKKSMFGTVVGDVQQGMAFGKQAASVFAGAPGGSGASPDANAGSSISASGSSSDSIQTIADPQTEMISGETPADGSSAPTSTFKPGHGPGSAGSNGGMLGGGGIQANAGGAISGALGMYSAVEGDGGVGGAFKGALSGEQLGMAVGGPIGAAIGLVAGGIVGAIGIGGREQARVYDLKTVRPKITGDMDSYHQGSMDYTSVYSDFQATDWQARLATGKMGPAAHDYYNDTIAKEIKEAEAKVTAEQKAGRSMYTTSAAQFDIGTDSVPHDGYAVIHAGERIMPSDQNERITQAIENQNSPESMRANYVSAMQARDARSSVSGGNRNLTMNVHAMDTRGVAQFFDQHKHIMRASLNDARAENSGGGVA